MPSRRVTSTSVATRRSAPAAPRPASPPEGEANVDALLDALRAVGRQLRMADREAEQLVGLHPAQLHTLQRLAEHPASSLAELAERTHTDPSSASVVVQRLVERGLVARREAAYDRRRIELDITAAGRTLLRRAPAGTSDRLAAAAAELGPTRAAALARGLRALSQVLREQTAAPDED
jgi:DNA-binding MarR family transcriptional regulator